MEERFSATLSKSPFYYRPFCLVSAVFLLCTVGQLLIGWSAVLTALGVWSIYFVYSLRSVGIRRSALPWLLLVTIAISSVRCGAYLEERGKTQKIAGVGVENTVSVSDEERGEVHRIVAEVDSVIYSESFGESYYVKLITIDGISVQGYAVLETDGDIGALPYDTVTCDGRIVEYESYGSDDNESYARSKDIQMLIVTDGGHAIADNKDTFRYFIYRIRGKIELALGRVCVSDAGSFAMAVMFGARDGMSQLLDRDFSAVGITHLLAVSGSHFSALSAALVFFLERVNFAKRWRIIPIFVFTVLFSALSGFSGAVLRAAVMAMFALVLRFFGYRPDPFIALFFSGAAICLFKPYTVFDIGFLLSFFATLGLLLQLGQLKLGDRFSNTVVKALSVLWESLKLTAAATLFTLPIIIFGYGTLSVLCLPINVIAGPIVTVAMFLAIAMTAVCCVPVLGKAVASVFDIYYRGIAKGIDAVAANSDTSFSMKAPFVVYSLVLSCCLYVLFRLLWVRKRLMAFLPLALATVCIVIGNVAYGVTADSRCSAAVVSENGNECVVLNTGGKTLICDIGSGSKDVPLCAVELAFDSFYVTDIDGFLLTDYYTKHISMLGKLMRNYYVRTVYLPYPQNTDEESISRSICKFAERYGSRVGFYGGTGDVSEIRFADATVTVFSSSLAGTDKRAISLGFATPNGSFAYFTADSGASEHTDEAILLLDRAGTAVIGNRGGYYPDSASLISQYTSANVYRVESYKTERYALAEPLKADEKGRVTAFFKLDNFKTEKGMEK